jgi:hypothetical protein
MSQINEFTGVVEGVVLDLAVGTTEYKKGYLILPQDDEYNPKIAVEFFGTQQDLIRDIAKGSNVTVKYNIKCKEASNGGWFTSLSGWAIDVNSAGEAPQAKPQEAPKVEADIPF